MAFGFGLLENIVEDDDGVSQFLLNFTGMAMSGNLTDEIPGGERNQRNNITCHEEEHKGFQIGGLEPKGFAHGSVSKRLVLVKISEIAQKGFAHVSV